MKATNKIIGPSNLSLKEVCTSVHIHGPVVFCRETKANIPNFFGIHIPDGLCKASRKSGKELNSPINIIKEDLNYSYFMDNLI